MALDADDEILQDFLLEASEILEQLDEQLVELEQSPDDNDLLNAVFRGFHTIKGGAGFLSLTALVDVCHRAEDIFNLLRNGEKQVTPQLMDTILPVLDVLNHQFDSLRALEEPEAAEAALLQQLEALAHPDAEAPAEEAAAPEPEATPVAEDAAAAPEAEKPQGDITDDEFEALLNALDEPEAAAETATPAAGSDEEITEDEFEALLDELHGKGKHGGVPEPATATEPAQEQAAASESEDITDDEFEALLDELHGKGKHGGVPEPAKPSVPGEEKIAASNSEDITEEEFEALLDELHGKGKHVGKPQEPAAEKPAAPAAAPKAEAKPAAPAKAAAPREPAARKKPENQGDTTVRVDTSRLDDIMNMVGELVLVRNRIATLSQLEDASLAREEMSKAVSNLDVVTSDLQTSVMKTRMQPIKKVFGRFPRVVRDLARSLKKEVLLEMQGEETDLDKNLVEALADPLVHLVRNSVDHGVEMPDVRETNGKPRAGTVLLAAEQEGDHILLVIEDDGGGMDADKLRGLAVSKGLMDEEAAARLDDKECFNLIFAPGFSTKEEISDISGRGVGMDVVKTRIAQLNGTIDIDSQLGKGTKLTIKVPLTLAIMPTLMVKLREQTFALPLASVNEIFNLEPSQTNIVDGQLVVMVRDKALPLYYLSNWLVGANANPGEDRTGHVVVVNYGTQMVGFVVEHLIGQEEVVIKPLGKMLLGTPGMAGATITGDGKIALILDIPSMMKAYARR